MPESSPKPAEAAALHCAMQLTEITPMVVLTAGMTQRYRQKFALALRGLSDQGVVRGFKFDGRLHYAPLCREGDAAYVAAFAMETTRPGPDSDCLIWKGRAAAGQGPVLHFDQKDYPLRRVIYDQSHHIKLKKHEAVRMSCDCAMCINPDHMAKEQRGEVLRGRPRPMGMRVRMAERERARTPYSMADVKAMKERYARGELSQAQAAKLLGISAKSMSRIMRGVTWRDFGCAYQALLN